MGTVRRVTNAQVKELRLRLHQGASLKMAAMKAGMDRKSARKYRDRDQLPSEARVPHSWRTRLDPLALVRPQLEEMLTREPTLQGAAQHVLGTGAVRRGVRRGTSGGRGDRGVVCPVVGAADAAFAWPEQTPHRLPAHHRLAGA
jgi:hypothetical protein